MPSLRAFLVLVVLACVGLLGAGCEQVAGVDFGSAHLKDGGVVGPNGGTNVATIECNKPCADFGFECGTQYDACGVQRDCGTCPDGKLCVAGKCQCQPKSCADLGAQCGPIADGCGGLLDCGACANPSDQCANNKCSCVGKTCAEQAVECGTVPDGCGQTYKCADCDGASANPNCGGNGPGKCGPNPCSPKSCADQGKNCGQIGNGCGGLLDCGNPCVLPQTCGGGGVANVCGCTPTTCAAQGKVCGSIPDGCGGTLNCGSCQPNYACAGDQRSCTCTSNGSCSECCGSGVDNCGNPCARSTCCGGGGCFGAGTPVRMADGSFKPIDQVQPGDHVASFDRTTGRMHASLVLARMTHGPETSREGFLVRKTPMGLFRVTPNHPLLIDGKRARADSLHAGSLLYTPETRSTPASFSPGILDMVIRAQTLESDLERTAGNDEPTYDLAVDGPGTYFAGNILVLQKEIP